MSTPSLPARVIKAGPKKPKRLSVAMRTGIVADNWQGSFFEPDHYMFTAPALPSGWSRDGRTNRVIKPHPFLEWFYANALGQWAFRNEVFHSGGEMGGKSWTSPAELHVRDKADAEMLQRAGLLKVHEERICLDLSAFDAAEEQAEEARKALANKAVLSKKRKTCPKPKRVIYRDDEMVLELRQSSWAGINLPPMLRGPATGHYNTDTKRPHPLRPDETIRAFLCRDKGHTVSYPTVLSSDPILDLLWNDDRLGEDWIITAPEVRSGGYGPTIVEDATVWFPTEDEAVFFKMLTRGA